MTSRHITGGRLDLANAYLISQADFDAINKRSKVDRWDVLVSMIGTVGEPCLIKEEPNFAIKNIGLFKSKGEAEGRWLYYYLRSPDTQQRIRELSRGTTQEYIPLGALREFPVLVPNDHGEMRAIGHILGALDDKIELNRRMNETLEQIARATFKSWFVDFLPVRANIAAKEGRTEPVLPEPEPGRWFVYALACKGGSAYIGHTEDLKRRWESHSVGRGANWTKRHKPMRVAYWEWADSLEEAVERERWLKTGFGRKWLKKRIARTQTGDPVRAKAEGRQSPLSAVPGAAQAGGLDPETALSACGHAQVNALFPDSVTDSPIGPVPKGWAVRTIADIARYVNGRNFTKNATGEGRMVIRIAELNSGTGGSTVYNRVEADPENVANPDDILFAWSGSLNVYRWHGDEALVNQHIFKVVCDEYPKWFVLYHLRQAMPFFQGIASHKATTMGHIKRAHLSEVSLAVPPTTLLEAASALIGPVYDMVHRLERQSRTLAAIRDALLPKLLSGEIRIAQAAKIVEGAA